MDRKLRLYIIGVVALGAIALAATTLVFPVDYPLGVGFGALGENAMTAGFVFWCLVTIAASALPVRMPRGTLVGVSIAPLIAASYLGGPAGGAWVALVGTTEWRELRGRIPWYGTLANHACLVLPAVASGLVMRLIEPAGRLSATPVAFAVAIAGAAVFYASNSLLGAALLALRTNQRIVSVLTGDARGFATSLLGLTPIGWLMAQMYAVSWWTSLIFAIPLYTTRLAYQRFNDMREMFTQTIGALAEAVDKRDPYTSKHSRRVMEIARDIGREMRLGENDLEALEWGGLLHDVGKIGVRDDVLLKQERLTKEERIKMNSHPVLGEEIIRPVTRLSRELPIIRHHHEWYNGSGYPDRLIGDEIPLNARVLHVADAFEAMTAARPYRMTPLTAEQALGELRKFAGIQFDPRIVDAFVRTSWADGIPDPGRTMPPRPIPLIAQHANQAAAPAAPAAGVHAAAPGNPTTAVPGSMPPA
jgi:putative nucleotidyltransferase with HDIG domain